jgi:phosphoenolpyruvate carboxykinase (GTP)
MLPFTGYNVSDYFQHWLDMGIKIEASGAAQPSIYCVNWFRTDDNGQFVWPGFGDNMRVLKWMLERIEGTGNGIENIFGITPEFGDLTWDGLEFSKEQFDTITSIDQTAWEAELILHAELFEKLEYHLPTELEETRLALGRRLAL